MGRKCGGAIMCDNEYEKKPKVITFYLPQYHRIPENDLWWGEGFTDWESARTAKPLFRGHYQPRLPRHNNFYNLLNKEVMQWQARLAKKQGYMVFASIIIGLGTSGFSKNRQKTC